MDLKQIEELVVLVPDFPKKGINFRNISPLLKNPKALDAAITMMADHYLTTQIDIVVGMDARGFIFGSLVAQKLRLPFVMARKPSKLPGEVERIAYDLEYTSACLEIEKNAIPEGSRCLVVDDILATGGSLLACCNLLKRVGATITGLCCLAEIEGLGGAERLVREIGVDCFCLVKFGRHNQPNQNEQTEHKQIAPQASLYVLMYHPSMKSLAQRLHYLYPHIFTIGHIQWDTFPDGYANIKFPDNLQGARVVFLASLYNKLFWMDQLSVMAVLPRQGIRSLDIMLPYFAPGTMERIEKPGILATADTYAQITSCVFPLTKEGPPVLSIFDLHNSTTRHSFSNNVCFEPLSAVPEVLKEMETMVGNDLSWAVVFPDEGSYKRFRGIIPPHISMIVCGKVRDGDKRIVRIMDKPAELKLNSLDHALIIDDLVQTGGTLHECYLALLREGVRRVSAFCTHAVFPNRAYLHFITGGKWAGFHNFWITDSIPEISDRLRGVAPFRILSLASPIIRNLQVKMFGANQTDISVVVTSEKNADKIKATREAFEYLFPSVDTDIIGMKTSSGVSEQPIGFDETCRGAIGRVESMGLVSGRYGLEEKGGNLMIEAWGEKGIYFQYVVSVENGIDPDTQEDFAIVHVRKWDNGIITQSTVRSESVIVDKDIWEMFCKEREQNPKLSCGQVYARERNYDASNWHLPVSGRCRSYYIKNAIIEAIIMLQ